MKASRLLWVGALIVACSDTSASAPPGSSDTVFDLPSEVDLATDLPGDVDVDVAADQEAVDADAPAVDTASDFGESDVNDSPVDVEPELGDASWDADSGFEDVDLADAADVVSCSDAGDCGVGFRCEADRCVALECHLGDYTEGIADKPCPAGQICEVLLGTADAFTCVAFERSCDFQSECPFGFRCTGSDCVLSECTVGNQDAGYGPRLCTEAGEICACMEDGSEINGGRGACVTDPVECP